jgi:hypothetical protein
LKLEEKINWPLWLMAGAAVADGLLAGGNLDRLLVATPAWTRVGLNGWADFTRSADLANGIIVYPAMALGGTVIVVLSAIIFAVGGRLPRHASTPVFLAAFLMLAALPFSLKATPFVMSLRHIDNGNVVELGRAFAGAHFWGGWQGILHLAAFCSEVWAIASLARSDPSVRPSRT